MSLCYTVIMQITWETTSDNISSAVNEEQQKTLFFDDIMSALKAVAPEGSTVCAIGFENTDRFLRAGYRVTQNNADVNIACGGEAEFALARMSPHKKLVLLPTHSHYAAACNVYRTEVKSFARLQTGEIPHAAAFDFSLAHSNHAALYGEIVSLDLCSFDAAFGARMDGRRPKNNVSNDIAVLVTSLTNELKSIEKDSAAQAKALASAGRRAAEIVAENPQLLHASGAAQAAEAHRMLCAHEGRNASMRGETEMLFGAYVTDFYIKSLTQKSFDFPPDNNKRIDSVCEYLGADMRRACVAASPIYSPQKLRLCEYRVNEFRTELLRMLYDIAKRRSAAWQVFKRLYPDDGYGLKTVVEKTDAPLCIALAPDVFKTNSLLSYLKQAGKLEKYVV